MACARIGNRLPRQGRRNPGRKHLRGVDVTDKMQRQYEHILESLRERHRFHGDRKRKSVAAATVWKLAKTKNPSAISSLFRNLGIGLDDESRAELLAEDFHGRPVRDVIDIEERDVYDEHVSVLGYLKELAILMEGEDSVIPIQFGEDDDPTVDEDTVYVVSNPAGTNIEFIGGDQDIDWRKVDGSSEEGKYLVWVGPVYSITYYTDKHHLTGPASQKTGTPYEHEFGDEGGDLPCLIFDRQNRRLMLVGGDYEITPEGIAG